MNKYAGEVVSLAGSATGAIGDDGSRAFGLCANFVGGDMDELGDRAEVGVWRGRGGVFEILAPAFDDTGLAAATAAEVGTPATEVYMNTTAKGVLAYDASSTGPEGSSLASPDHRAVARCVTRLSANAIVVELLV